MLARIIEFCLKQKFLVLMGVGFLVFFGAYAFDKLPIDAFPEVTNVQVQVTSQAPGFSPLEVEKLVTYPIEIELSGLPRLQELRSISMSSLSSVWATFEDGVDVYFARQLVLERIISAKERLPQAVTSGLAPVTTAMGEVYRYTLEYPDSIRRPYNQKQLMDLRTVQEWTVKLLLKTVPGVVEVSSMGGFVRQFHVLPRLDRLRKYHLSLKEVFQAIQENNSVAAGNILNLHSEQNTIRGIGLIRSMPDIENIVVKTHEGTPVFIRDVAEVTLGYETRRGAGVENGEGEAVGGAVMMIKDGNARQIVDQVKKKVAEINASGVLPDGMQILPYYDRTFLVDKSIGTVEKALLEGILLVVLVVYLFLRNFRSSLVISLALPLAAFATFIFMHLLGLSANLMSLGGLAISIGMIIDAAIIQVENVERHLAENNTGKSRFKVILDSVLEVRKPSIFGELIIAFTFLPILSLQGMEGKLFTPLAKTVILALLSSLALSIFVIPVLSFLSLRPHSRHQTTGITKLVKSTYSRILSFCLRRRGLAVGAALLFLVGSLAAVPFLGSEFIPYMDEGSLLLEIFRLPSVSLDESIKIEEQVEKRLMQFSEVKKVVSTIGTAEASTDIMGQQEGEPIVVLKPEKEWKTAKSKKELIEKMREAVEKVPGTIYNFSQPIAMRVEELTSGVKSRVAVKIFGEDLAVLKVKSGEIARVISGVPGAVDVHVGQLSGQPTLSLEADRQKMARFGINAAAIQEIIEIAVGGKVATEVLEGDRRTEVVVRFPEEQRNSVEAIGSIPVESPSGAPIPMAQLVNFKWEENPAAIEREGGKRRMVVAGNAAGRDIGGFVKECQQKVKETVQLPPGYYVEWGGTFEQQQRANRRLAVVMPLTVLLVFFLLYTTFGQARLAFLVLLNLPFALTGGILALLVSGLYLSVPASVGFIALFGVAVLNGVVLISYINQLRQSGMPLEEAIRTGCARRLRPVSMTALVTMLALTPLIFATGVGSEVQKPLAVVVVGGLLTSTTLTLLVLPVLYGWFAGGKKEVRG